MATDLARWQFGITTVYHFIFVPLTIGISPLIAIMQTMWVKTKEDRWFRLTKFFGKLFLINFALGVATGIVQEFQFGLNWSTYASFVGDIFGAPLAMEALAAFFIESTFIGLWIFGWGRLSKGAHLTTVWMTAFGVNLSAYFILAANSFMQDPKGAVINTATGRAEMSGISKVLFSPLTITTWFHVVTSSLLLAGTFIGGICVWWIVKLAKKNDEARAHIYHGGAVLGCIVMIIAGLGVIVTGDLSAQQITKLQPSKMAAAEGLCITPSGNPTTLASQGTTSSSNKGAAFTIAGWGNCDVNNASGGTFIHIGQIPDLLSLLATHSSHGNVLGANDVAKDFQSALTQAAASGTYPSASTKTATAQAYVPPVTPTFWSFRFMMGTGVFSAILAIGILFALRKGRTSTSRWLKFWGLLAIPMPFIGIAFGWIFTEIGRQPWIVYPDATDPASSLYLMTRDAASPTVGSFSVWLTLICFTLIYGVMGFFWFKLMIRYARAGIAEDEKTPDEIDDNDGSKPLSFAY